MILLSLRLVRAGPLHRRIADWISLDTFFPLHCCARFHLASSLSTSAFGVTVRTDHAIELFELICSVATHGDIFGESLFSERV
jgi:hypothetical protein